MFYPTKKNGMGVGGWQQVLAMLKGRGHRTCWVVLTWTLEAVAMLTGEGGGGYKLFAPFKREGSKGFTLSCGGRGAKSFGPASLPLCMPPPPDRSHTLSTAT